MLAILGKKLIIVRLAKSFAEGQNLCMSSHNNQFFSGMTNNGLVRVGLTTDKSGDEIKRKRI